MRSIFSRLAAITPRQFALFLTLLIVAVSMQYTFKVLDLRNGKQDRSAILRWREFDESTELATRSALSDNRSTVTFAAEPAGLNT